MRVTGNIKVKSPGKYVVRLVEKQVTNDVKKAFNYDIMKWNLPVGPDFLFKGVEFKNPLVINDDSTKGIRYEVIVEIKEKGPLMMIPVRTSDLEGSQGAELLEEIQIELARHLLTELSRIGAKEVKLSSSPVEGSLTQFEVGIEVTADHISTD